MSGLVKYFHFARIAFGDHLNNRLRVFSRFLIYLLLLWVMVAMWRIIYQSGHGPETIPLADMSWYVAIAQMMFFLSPRLFVIIDDDVRSGNIGYFLNRPMPYLWMRFTEGLGALFGNFLVYYTFGILIAYWWIGAWPSGGLEAIFLSIILISIGSAIHLIFQIISGLSAFWTNDAIFIYHSYQKFMLLLGGVYIPISLYPSFMGGRFLELLPFAAMVGNPSALLIPVHNESFWTYLVLQIFWLAAIAMIARMMYGFCLKKVEVNGG